MWHKVDTFEDFKEKVYLEMSNGQCIFAEVSYCLLLPFIKELNMPIAIRDVAQLCRTQAGFLCSLVVKVWYQCMAI